MISLPRKLLIGGGKINDINIILKEFKYNKPLIITDNFLTNNGTLDKLIKPLNENNDIKYGIFNDTIPDPTTDSIDKIKEELIKNKYDSIIALGGGSPMDSAKAAAVLSTHGGKMRDYKAPYQFNDKSLPIIAIPTTAGTGSEVTKFTIISDTETDEKMLCIGEAYLPICAIVDYELTLSMPYRLTVDTGIDSLCHAMEAYVSEKRNPFSDTSALSSLTKISKYIRLAANEPNNHEARENMMLAATEAGIAFSNASVTLIHGMSRPLGYAYHIPHGLSNAQLAPQITKFSIQGRVDRYSQVARAMGLVDHNISNEDAAELLPKKLLELNKELKVPTLKDFGVDKESFNKNLTNMAKAAIASGSPNNNPIIPNENEIKNLYSNIYNGIF